jgi:hypothetical protein
MDPAIEERVSGYRGFQIAMIIIPTVAVMLRFYARYANASVKEPMFWWDDWAVLAALPFSIVTSAGNIEITNYGFGQHIEDISPSNLLNMLKILYMTCFAFNISSALPKASALFFFQRIFTTKHSNTLKWTMWITQIANGLWLIGATLGLVFSCHPVEKGWNPVISGHCNTAQNWLGATIPSVIIDLVILLLPLPRLWKLQINMPRKIGLIFTFLCGYTVVIVSTGRLITLLKNNSALSADLTYVALPIFYWYNIEPPLMIVSVSLIIIASSTRRLWRTKGRPYIQSHYGSLSVTRSLSKWSVSEKLGSYWSNSTSGSGSGTGTREDRLSRSLDSEGKESEQRSRDGSRYDAYCAKEPSSTTADLGTETLETALPSLNKVHVRKDMSIYSEHV